MKIKLCLLFICTVFLLNNTYTLSSYEEIKLLRQPSFIERVLQKHTKASQEKITSLSTNENKSLMIKLLNILNKHGLISNEENSLFHFHRNEDTQTPPYVNEYIRELDEDGFYDKAEKLTQIINNRANEGRLVGLSHSELATLLEWQRFIKRSGIQFVLSNSSTASLPSSSVTLPDGFKQAAEEMDDILFYNFINYLQEKLQAIIYEVMSTEKLGEEEPPLRAYIKRQLSRPNLVRIKLKGGKSRVVKRSLARAGYRALAIRYAYRSLTKEEIKNGLEHPPIKEEISVTFGIITPDFIDLLESEGILVDYNNTYFRRYPNARMSIGDNPYLLIKHLLDGEPISEECFSNTHIYNNFIDILLRYKLKTGEIGLSTIGNESQQIEIAKIIQKKLNKIFGVKDGKNILPIDVLLLSGLPQPRIHHRYGGRKIRRIIEYIDPMIHILNALRQLRTDGLPNARCSLRTALLLHDIGKRNIKLEGLRMRQHEAESRRMAKKALTDLDKDGFNASERALIFFLVGTHSTFGIVHRLDTWEDPKMEDVVGRLKVPEALIGNVSPQLLILLHKRIYEADTSSIENINWVYLPDEHRGNPEEAPPMLRSEAVRSWFWRVRSIYKRTLKHYYLMLYKDDNTFREILNPLNVKSTEDLNNFLDNLIEHKQFPRLFIQANIDFNINNAKRLLKTSLKIDQNIDDSLLDRLVNYFLISDMAISSSDITNKYIFNNKMNQI